MVETAPMDDAAHDLGQDVLMETETQGRPLVNRISYELCVPQALRERLRCKDHRTIFLCRYLRPPELRREIQEGLDVVETWNSANG